MTRINFCIVGQMEQPLDDVGAKLLVVATWEVGAADAAAEERVTREHPTLDFGIETYASHGMAWRADDLEGALPHLDDLAIFQIDIGKVAVTQKRHPKHSRLLPRTKEVVLHIRMRRHFDTVTLFHRDVTHDMVDMAMRIDSHQRLEVMAVDETEEFVFLACIRAAWVDNDTFLGVVIVNDISVFRKGIEDKLFQFKHSIFFDTAFRQAQGPKVVESVEALHSFARAKIRFFPQ